MRNKKAIILLTMLCLLVGSAMAGRGPNIILIMADDLGYAGLSCYGNTHGIKTPHLDHMAENGLKFTDFHSNGAVCSPTRAALMTGRYQQRTGITGVVTAANHRNQGLALSETTMAEVLKAGGYRTALFGKWHVGYSPKFNPVKQGFDEFIGFVSGNVDYQSHFDQVMKEDWWKQDQLVPEKGYQTTLIGNHGVDFIKRNADQPFFLYLAFGAPHYPIQGPNDPPVRGKDAVRVKNFDVQRAHREMIESMDLEIGRIKAQIEKHGLTDNTLIFFCSDNGHARNAKWSADPRLRGSKGTVFEGGTRVPGIAYWPGSIRPGVTAQTAMTMDLLPTCATLSASPLPADITYDGIDLSSLLLTRQILPTRDLFWSVGGSGAMRSGPWKYVKAGKTESLYNLDDDLSESVDLSKEQPKRFQKMAEQYTEWFRSVTAAPTGPEIDPDASPTPPLKAVSEKKKIKLVKLADYPIQHGVAGPFSGIADNRLIVAGGCYFPDGKPWEGGSKFWDDRIFILDGPTGEWKAAGRLSATLSYGMTISDETQLLCFGGEAAGKVSKEVFALQPVGDLIKLHPLPPLPHPISKAGIVRLGDRIYILCGKIETGASNRIWSAPLPYTGRWRREADFPKEGRTSCSVVVAGEKILLFGGRSGNALHEFIVHTDVHEFSPASRTWRELLPEERGIAAQTTPIAMTPAGPVLFGSGGSPELSLHQRIANAKIARTLEENGDTAEAEKLIAGNTILMKNDQGHSGDISRLNLKTLEWEKMGQLPDNSGAVLCGTAAWHNGWVIVSGELRPGVRTPRVLYLEL